MMHGQQNVKKLSPSLSDGITRSDFHLSCFLENVQLSSFLFYGPDLFYGKYVTAFTFLILWKIYNDFHHACFYSNCV